MHQPMNRTEAPLGMPGFVEFVALIALLMALTALSIDIMLPALPQIGQALDVADPNRRQLVVTAYMLGFAAGQIVFGPLSDRFGRKPILLCGLIIFAAASLASALAADFQSLLIARAVQGLGCAAPRVMAIAIVRDLYGGRHMARVMSFVMTVFIIAPIVAPGIGEALLIVGRWEWIFQFLFLVALLTIAWSSLRLPETQTPEKREPLSLAWLIRAFGETVTTRQTLGYTISASLVFGALLGYINSAQQIFVDIYGAGSMFPVLFGVVAIALAAAAFLNGRLVVRLGMRWLSHIALIGFFGVAVILLALSLLSDGVPPLWAFCALLSLNLFCFGFAMPNYNALAMEPLGHIAGTASSFVGAFTTAGAAVLGWYVGQQFDGTVVPLALGYVGLGALAILAVAVTERGRLFAGRTA